MKPKNWIFIIPGLMIFIFTSAHALGQNKIANDSTQRDKLVYTCSMHPEIQSDKPGNCPKCGMELVQKFETLEQQKQKHEMDMPCPMEHGMNDMNHPKEKNKMAPVAIGMGVMMAIMLFFLMGN